MQGDSLWITGKQSMISEKTGQKGDNLGVAKRQLVDNKNIYGRETTQGKQGHIFWIAPRQLMDSVELG